jgi:hypothetical protein
MKNIVVRNIKRTDADLVKRLGALGVATVHEAYGRGRKDAAEVVERGEKRHADEAGKRKQLAAGVLGLDMYNLRESLKKAGLVYVDELPED